MCIRSSFFFFQAEDGIRDRSPSRGLGDVYKRQSLSTTKEIFTGGLLASGLHFENYTKALFTNKAALNLLNSVIYTVPSCILIIVVCAPAAYCMSRFKFRGAGLIQALIIIGLAIPNIMIVMPLFSVVSALNLSGTHFTLIFLYTACSVPYTTFFPVSYTHLTLPTKRIV